MGEDLAREVERLLLANEVLAFVNSELDAGEMNRFWELMESAQYEGAIREAEKVAVKCRLGGQFWIKLAMAADEFGMSEEAATYLARSEVRVRDW